MQSYLTFIFLAALSALKSIIKDPSRREAIRDVALRLRDAITMIYEPESHQGTLTAKVDLNRFVDHAIGTHTGAIVAARYQPGSFDGFLDEDNDGVDDRLQGGTDNASS